MRLPSFVKRFSRFFFSPFLFARVVRRVPHPSAHKTLVDIYSTGVYVCRCVRANAISLPISRGIAFRVSTKGIKGSDELRVSAVANNELHFARGFQSRYFGNFNWVRQLLHTLLNSTPLRADPVRYREKIEQLTRSNGEKCSLKTMSCFSFLARSA